MEPVTRCLVTILVGRVWRGGHAAGRCRPHAGNLNDALKAIARLRQQSATAPPTGRPRPSSRWAWRPGRCNIAVRRVKAHGMQEKPLMDLGARDRDADARRPRLPKSRQEEVLLRRAGFSAYLDPWRPTGSRPPGPAPDLKGSSSSRRGPTRPRCCCGRAEEGLVSPVIRLRPSATSKCSCSRLDYRDLVHRFYDAHERRTQPTAAHGIVGCGDWRHSGRPRAGYRRDPTGQGFAGKLLQRFEEQLLRDEHRDGR